MRIKLLFAGLMVTGIIAALMLSCSGVKPATVVVYTSVDQVFAEPVFRQFEQESGIKVRAVFDTEETKSTGIVNRLIAEAGNPQADVFWSGDPVRPFQLMQRGLVQPYRSDQAKNVPAAFQSDEGLWTGVSGRGRVLLVNTKRLGNQPLPQSVRDLADPRWQGQTAMANPLFGTTTMQVATWFNQWGEESAKSFLDQLKQNRVRLASSNGEVKRLVVNGEVTFGLADTDDAFEALKAKAPVAVVYPDQDDSGTLFMPTAVLLLRRGPNPEAGKKLIDHLLTSQTEVMLLKSGGFLPLRPDVETPADILKSGQMKKSPADYGQIAITMERIQPYLRQWVGL